MKSVIRSKEPTFLKWKYYDKAEMDLLLSIKEMFGYRYKHLLKFLFHLREPILIDDSVKILKEANVLSSGEQILLQLALDIWDGSGNCKIKDLFKTLDIDLIMKVLKIFMKLR